jgi:formiminotetrahydrofolate cyclodeaminase
MLSKSCNLFLDELGSNAPVPGGGSASALVGAIGTALGTMVGELTTGKKTYAQYEDEIQQLLAESRSLTEVMKESVQKDMEAFKPLSVAYKMPNSTDEEKEAKNKAVQESLEAAASAPLELAENCVKALKLLDRYSEIGSRLAVSDAGTGALMCLAALKGARLNVLTNTRMMEDGSLREKLDTRLSTAVSEGERIARTTYARAEKIMIG